MSSREGYTIPADHIRTGDRVRMMRGPSGVYTITSARRVGDRVALEAITERGGHATMTFTPQLMVERLAA